MFSLVILKMLLDFNNVFVKISCRDESPGAFHGLAAIIEAKQHDGNLRF